MNRWVFLCGMLLLMASCNPGRRLSTSIPAVSQTRTDYIATYAALAVEEMKRTGVPASITLAQGLLESDNGNSRLAREGNNHFGIKCHSDWNGKRIYHDDDRRNECFRSYSSVRESYRDHSDFLVRGSRYDFLFELKCTDYKGWSRGLRKAGYATNKDYANLLIRIIEDNQLYLYDKKNGRLPEQLEQGRSIEEAPPGGVTTGNTVREAEFHVSMTSPRIMQINRIDCIRIREGDTFNSLAEEFDLLSWEIRKYNEMDGEAKLKAGSIIFLQPKRKKAEAGMDSHQVVEGETMYSISQKYGIRLRNLYKMNQMEEGRKPIVGQTIRLR